MIGWAGWHPNRFLTNLTDAGYLDGYRARHKAGGLTFARAGVLVSRLDYVMVRGLDGGERAVTAAVVVRPPVRTPHHAVLVSLAGVWSPLRSYLWCGLGSPICAGPHPRRSHAWWRGWRRLW